jgi:hypothetical protein
MGITPKLKNSQSDVRYAELTSDIARFLKKSCSSESNSPGFTDMLRYLQP